MGLRQYTWMIRERLVFLECFSSLLSYINTLLLLSSFPQVLDVFFRHPANCLMKRWALEIFLSRMDDDERHLRGAFGKISFSFHFFHYLAAIRLDSKKWPWTGIVLFDTHIHVCNYIYICIYWCTRYSKSWWCIGLMHAAVNQRANFGRSICSTMTWYTATINKSGFTYVRLYINHRPTGGPQRRCYRRVMRMKACHHDDTLGALWPRRPHHI